MANSLVCVAAPAEIGQSFAALTTDIFHSAHFDKNHILRAHVSFSQAYCLLWQDPDTGDLDGRRSCGALQAGLICAILLDLACLDRVVITSQVIERGLCLDTSLSDLFAFFAPKIPPPPGSY